MASLHTAVTERMGPSGPMFLALLVGKAFLVVSHFAWQELWTTPNYCVIGPFVMMVTLCGSSLLIGTFVTAVQPRKTTEKILRLYMVMGVMGILDYCLLSLGEAFYISPSSLVQCGNGHGGNPLIISLIMIFFGAIALVVELVAFLLCLAEQRLFYSQTISEEDDDQSSLENM
jgi:hypothetical protein